MLGASVTVDRTPRAVVCIPTYDERENLEQMVVALGKALDTSRDRVLVIDDASPDGTGDIADRLATELPWISVLHRPEKNGLGPAYVAGLRHALDTGAELVIEMDCDFSHDPRDVPRLIAAAAECDVVLGSRYVDGGCTENRAFRRRLVSRGGCLYARIVLGIDVRDVTCGFRCFRRSAIEAIEPESLASRGYAFHIEVLYRAVRAGLRIKEIPIRFLDRRAGASKMNASIVGEAMWNVLRLRAQCLGDTRSGVTKARSGSQRRHG